MQKIILLPLFVAILPVGAFSMDLITPSDYTDNLSQQVECLKRIALDTEQVDQLELRSMQVVAKNAHDLIDKHGIADSEAYQSIQTLVIARKFSVGFLDEIRTDRSSKLITKVIELSQEISSATRLDTHPSTQVTAAVFRQMHKLLESLSKDSVLGVALTSKVLALIEPMGKLVGKASAYESIDTYKEGIRLHDAVIKLYPDFDKIGPINTSLMDTVETIKSLNFYYQKAIGGISTASGESP